MNAILPCPFCGDEPIQDKHHILMCVNGGCPLYCHSFTEENWCRRGGGSRPLTAGEQGEWAERTTIRLERLEKALESIASNSCCERCREAAAVAREALDNS